MGEDFVRTAIAQARSVTVSAEAVDSVLMPGSSFRTAPDVRIITIDRKQKGERSKAGRIWPLLYHRESGCRRKMGVQGRLARKPT